MSWDYIMKFVIAGEASVGKTSILFRLTDERFLSTPDPTIGVEFGSKLLRVTPPSAASSSSTDPSSPTNAAAPGTDDDDDAKWIKLQCWDVAGSPSFRAVTRSYYRGSAGALLVYDVTRPETFAQIPSWLADVRANADPECSIILIGNKADLVSPPLTVSTDDASAPPPTSDSASSTNPPPSSPSPAPAPAAVASSSRVPTSEAQAFAARENLLFLETSAKTGANVTEAFDATARAILAKIVEGQLDAAKPGSRRGEGRRGIKLGESEGQVKGKGGCC